MEIRVYYECLEQAAHYVKPLVEEGLAALPAKDRPTVRLVRNPPNARALAPGRLRAIFQLTTPDFLISVADQRSEVPVVIGEFSESVLTEDHELQRSIGAIAGAVTNAFYLKISGAKESNREHGGNIDFNPLTIARAMKDRYGYPGYIIAEWAASPSNRFLLQRDSMFLSCPAREACTLAEEILRRVPVWAASAWRGGMLDPAVEFTRSHAKDRWLASYVVRTDAVPSVDAMFMDWSRRAEKEGWQRVTVSAESLIVKVNRFSHAADPDRGVLTILSALAGIWSVYARYSVKPKAMAKTNSLIDAFEIQADEEDLRADFRGLIHSALRGGATTDADITDRLEPIRESLLANKVLFTLTFFADGLVIHQKGDRSRLRVTWSRERLWGLKPGGLIPALRHLLIEAAETAPQSLVCVGDELVEDEIVFGLVHQILRPNGFRIVSVSYPGAQGDAAILAERTKGRSQERIYIDVIAWLSDGSHTAGGISLTEAKGTLDVAAVESDVRKLVGVRDEPAKRKALDETLARLGHGQPKFVVVGLTFGAAPGFRTTWIPHDVDFLIRVSSNYDWDVATFGTRLDGAFSVRSGRLQFPARYRLQA